MFDVTSLLMKVKLLKALFTLILLSSSVAASADPEVLQVDTAVSITKWHTHWVNSRTDSGDMIVTCDSSAAISLSAGHTHKCPGASDIYVTNAVHYTTSASDELSNYGIFNHSGSSCSDSQNLLTVTGKGTFDEGELDDVCSQDMTLDGISEN